MESIIFKRQLYLKDNTRDINEIQKHEVKITLD